MEFDPEGEVATIARSKVAAREDAFAFEGLSGVGREDSHMRLLLRVGTEPSLIWKQGWSNGG